MDDNNQGILYVSGYPPETKESDIINFFAEKKYKVMYYREAVTK